MKTVTLKEQNKILKKHGLPQVAIPKKLPNLPDGAEDIFLVPTWDKVSKTYPEAVQLITDLLEKERGLKNWRKGALTDKHVRQRNKVTIEVFAAQLGSKYKGKSVDNVRSIGDKSEFLLGAWEIGVICLTHPDLLSKGSWEGIDCANDEYSYDGGGRFSESLRFYVYDGEFKFDWRVLDYPYGLFGSASGFFPQTLAPRPTEAFVPLKSSKLVLEAIESIEDKLKEIKGMIK